MRRNNSEQDTDELGTIRKRIQMNEEQFGIGYKLMNLEQFGIGYK